MSSSAKLTLRVISCTSLITLLTDLWWLLSSASHSLSLCKIAFPLRRTLTTAYIIKGPLASVPRCQHSVPCKPQIPLTHISSVRLSNVERRLLVPPSSLNSVHTSRRSTWPLGGWKKSSALFAQDNYLHCDGSGRRSGERERGTSPFVLGLRQTSRCRSHRRLSWSSTTVILQDNGVRTACRPITNSICLLTTHTSTIALCGVPEPLKTCKEPQLHILDVLWVLAFYPRTSFSTSLAIHCSPHLQCSARILPRPAGQQQP